MVCGLFLRCSVHDAGIRLLLNNLPIRPGRPHRVDHLLGESLHASHPPKNFPLMEQLHPVVGYLWHPEGLDNVRPIHNLARHAIPETVPICQWLFPSFRLLNYQFLGEHSIGEGIFPFRLTHIPLPGSLR